MDILLFWQSLIQGIVQGITEFLPISSTGHMIVVGHYMKMDEQFSKMFEVVIQLGSILSVVVYFYRKLLPFDFDAPRLRIKIPWELWIKILIAVIPALVIGATCGKWIKQYLFSSPVVASMLVIGGIVLLWADKTERENTSLHEISELPYAKAFWIGMIQCLAMIPGTSRSASTIIGAMFLGCSRKLAAEFSFFLAIPTMVAASAYSLMQDASRMNSSEWIALGIGFVTAFLVALGVIAWLMSYIQRHDFKIFGWYRIAAGILIFALLYFKVLS